MARHFSSVPNRSISSIMSMFDSIFAHAMRRSPMPKKKKPVRELTNDEIADRVFPKKLKSQLRKIAGKKK
jgi:uncharacterized protein YozE (UPF0346 family)